MPDWTRDRRAWRAALLGSLALVLAVVAWRYLEKIQKPSRNGTYSRSAFLRWRDQIHALEAGEDIYRKFNYPNPPIQALVLLPLMHLERVPGAMLWFALKIGWWRARGSGRCACAVTPPAAPRRSWHSRSRGS